MGTGVAWTGQWFKRTNAMTPHAGIDRGACALPELQAHGHTRSQAHHCSCQGGLLSHTYSCQGQVACPEAAAHSRDSGHTRTHEAPAWTHRSSSGPEGEGAMMNDDEISFGAISLFYDRTLK